MERRYFFVSQSKTYKQESNGQYLWAPDDQPWHHQTMRRIQPGDLILNYTNQTIAAISIAKCFAYKANKPSEFDVSTIWQEEGLKVNVDVNILPRSLPKSSFFDFFLRNQESYHGVVNSNGVNQIYLGEINQSMIEKVLDECEKYKENIDVIAKIRNLTSIKSINLSSMPVIEKEQEMSEEKQKIEQIKVYIASKGFTYRGNLIENLYLSLKSKPFVILAGTSGTGKSKLVKLFAESIQAEYKLIPVRPDWSDSSDLFGHLDLEGNFVPGAVTDYIYRAKNDSSKPYILCLDEMNLARVEYYLSDFLSVIETRRFVNNLIVTDPILTKESYGNDKTGAFEKYGELYIPENLYVIGTVNMDETTFPFSKKVLDRANTIEFSDVDLRFPDNFSSCEEKSLSNITNDFLKSKYLILMDCINSKTYLENVCLQLQNLNQILLKANMHVGYRVRDEIAFYMLNNNCEKIIEDIDAFDNAIMQKILPRIQGSSNAIKEVLYELFKYCIDNVAGIQIDQNSESENLFNYLNTNVPKYKNSAEKIAFMIRRYEEDGFTSFWL